MSGETLSPDTPRIDASSKVPLHIQIRNAIRRDALAGSLVDPEGRLMTEAELGAHFGVSRVTIRNALQPLVDEGMFSRERGRGTFLRSAAVENWVGRLMGFSETMREAGYAAGARILEKGMTNRQDAEVSEKLAERAVWHLHRLRTANDIPVAIEHAFYPPDIGLELEHRDLESILMYRVFEDDMGLTIHEADQTIGAVTADEATASLLGIEPGRALLSMDRLTVSTGGRALEFLRSVYVPEYFRFAIKLARRTGN